LRRHLATTTTTKKKSDDDECVCVCVGSRAGDGVNLSFSKSLWKRDDMCVDDFSSSCRANAKECLFL
jgi:hypothetical protein